MTRCSSSSVIFNLVGLVFLIGCAISEPPSTPGGTARVFLHHYNDWDWKKAQTHCRFRALDRIRYESTMAEQMTRSGLAENPLPRSAFVTDSQFVTDEWQYEFLLTAERGGSGSERILVSLKYDSLWYISDYRFLRE